MDPPTRLARLQSITSQIHDIASGGRGREGSGIISSSEILQTAGRRRLSFHLLTTLHPQTIGSIRRLLRPHRLFCVDTLPATNKTLEKGREGDWLAGRQPTTSERERQGSQITLNSSAGCLPALTELGLIRLHSRRRGGNRNFDVWSVVLPLFLRKRATRATAAAAVAQPYAPRFSPRCTLHAEASSARSGTAEWESSI